MVLCLLLTTTFYIFVSASTAQYPLGEFNITYTLNLNANTTNIAINQRMLLIVTNQSGIINLLHYNLITQSLLYSTPLTNITANTTFRFLQPNYLIIQSKSVTSVQQTIYTIEQHIIQFQQSIITNNTNHNHVIFRQKQIVGQSSLIKLVDNQGNKNVLMFVDVLTAQTVLVYDFDDILNITKLVMQSQKQGIVLLYNDTIGYLSVHNAVPTVSWHHITEYDIIDLQYSSNYSHMLTAENQHNSNTNTNIAHFRLYSVANQFRIADQIVFNTGPYKVVGLSLNINDQLFSVWFSNYQYLICNFNAHQCYNHQGKTATQMSPITQSKNYTCKFINSTHMLIVNYHFGMRVLLGRGDFQAIMDDRKQWSYWPQGRVDIQKNIQAQNTSNLQSAVIYQLPSAENTDFMPSSSLFVGTLSFPNAKQLFKIFNPLFLFIQDYWFYSYHNRTYSESVQKAFDLIRQINQAKILPTFLQQITQTIKSEISWRKLLNISNYDEFTPDRFLNNQKQGINFISNTEDVLLWNYFYSCLFFVIIKLSGCLCPSNLTFVKSYLTQKSQNAVLWIILIENNLQYLTFMVACQLQQPSLKQFSDKIKMAMAVLVLFVLLMYSIAGYLLIQIALNKQNWKLFLDHKTVTKQSCQYTSLNLTTRSLLMGFVHGYYLQHPLMQMYLITILNVAALVILCVFWKASKCKLANLLLSAYLLVKILFDLAILNQIGILYQLEIMEIVLIFVLVVVIIMLFFWFMFMSFVQNFGKYFRHKKINYENYGCVSKSVQYQQQPQYQQQSIEDDDITCAQQIDAISNVNTKIGGERVNKQKQNINFLHFLVLPHYSKYLQTN